jgi:CheY-like chemotaxis protein
MSQPARKAILVVEDNEDDVFLLRRGFQKANLDPVLHIVPDGQAAIEYLRAQLATSARAPQFLPALTLLDLQLPYFTGLQVLRWIRGEQVFSRMPVVVFTSSSNAADIESAYQIGANAYLVKPSDLDEQMRLAQLIYHFWLEFNQLPIPEPTPER